MVTLIYILVLRGAITNKSEEMDDNGEDTGCQQQRCVICNAACGDHDDNNDDHRYSQRLCRGCAAFRTCRCCKRRLPNVCFDDKQQDTCWVIITPILLTFVFAVLFCLGLLFHVHIFASIFRRVIREVRESTYSCLLYTSPSPRD